MSISIEKVKLFVRTYEISGEPAEAEKTAENCINLLRFMPTVSKEFFNERVTKLYSNLHVAETQILATTKDWLDNKLGIRKEFRRNDWSNRQQQFWNAVLKPCAMGKGILTQFVYVTTR